MNRDISKFTFVWTLRESYDLISLQEAQKRKNLYLCQKMDKIKAYNPKKEAKTCRKESWILKASLNLKRT